MDKSQIISAIALTTLLLMVLMAFLLFMLFWQRRKSNRYIKEKEIMTAMFNEQLLRSQLEIQEQSFNVISMEIHDNVGQTLSLLNVQLNIIDQQESLDRLLLADAKESVKKAMTDLRDIAKSLNSERIKLASLPDITAHESQRINQTGLVKVSVANSGDEQALQDGKKLIIFRMIQECLQNIIKHSAATMASVNFAYQPDFLEIQITDDGIGFNTDMPADGAGFGIGLKNIFKRATAINGNVHIDSQVNKGTTITIRTPYA
ncbi:sensor histidine kinase [Mucilaginibacter pedocola]|uniref:Oxygen sensor histidine kinase NreB n=1 Tax=Mucilaginibacter pedocola TaxID=1792845 RepID=A0A1S9PAG7_9SPHI|nr:ATP-binding protein [Mucilaginibacter pedocola]OOQ57974.1 hypothetical protein BC343_09895 [Mucilaginibacter pedocola]